MPTSPVYSTIGKAVAVDLGATRQSGVGTLWHHAPSRPVSGEADRCAISRVLFIAAERSIRAVALTLADWVELDWVLGIEAASRAGNRPDAHFDLAVLDVPRAPEGGERSLPRVAEIGELLPELPLLALVESREEGRELVRDGAHGFVLKARLDKGVLFDAAFMAMELHRTRLELGDVGECLVHADRLASIGQLTAGVAHEINNPMASLLANLTSMRDQVAAALGAGAGDGFAAQLGEWADVLDESIASVGHVRSIARELRGFSRIDGHVAEIIDVNDVLETACRLTDGLVRRRARLYRQLRPVATVRGSYSKLVQVFTNLLTNAAQAIEGRRSDNQIRVSTDECDGSIVAAVEDTGTGIPEEIRKLVFEPFFTTKSRDEGNGLGLSVSAEIVRACGGDIAFIALDGGGTRFEVRLPVDGRPVQSAVASGRGASLARPQPRQTSQVWRARVLLIDDEPSLLRAFRRVLAPRHDVVLAANGQQGLDILHRDSAFDGVICDFTMPDIDGIRIYEAMATRDSELAERIVFCTGGPVSHRGRAFIETTSNTVLEKPVSPELLLGAIEQLGKR